MLKAHRVLVEGEMVELTKSEKDSDGEGRAEVLETKDLHLLLETLRKPGRN